MSRGNGNNCPISQGTPNDPGGKLTYVSPLAEVICFRPMEDLSVQLDDPYKRTMDMFDYDQSSGGRNGSDIDVDDPWLTQ